MNPAVAIAVCAVMIIACIAGLLMVSYARQAATGKHARRPAASPEGARFAAYLAGTPQPPEPSIPDWPPTPGPQDADWWEQEPPQPPAVEIITGPGTRIAQTSELTLGVLARVRDQLLPDAWKPEPAEVTFTPADPGDTCTDLKPVKAAPEYLAAPQ